MKSAVSTLPLTGKEHRIVQSVLRVLIRYLYPTRIFLFGSRVKGQLRRNADFDLAVDVKRVDLRTHRVMMEEIEEVAGLYSVDIVYLKSVDREFKRIILQTGAVVYEAAS